jgi:hypothetical protein
MLLVVLMKPRNPPGLLFLQRISFKVIIIVDIQDDNGLCTSCCGAR